MKVEARCVRSKVARFASSNSSSSIGSSSSSDALLCKQNEEISFQNTVYFFLHITVSSVGYLLFITEKIDSHLLILTYMPEKLNVQNKLTSFSSKFSSETSSATGVQFV